MEKKSEYEKCDICFRLLQLNKEQLEEIYQIFPSIERDYHKRKGGSLFTAVLDLEVNLDYSALITFCEKYSIGREDCDIYIGVLSEYDERTYALPDHVLDLKNKIDTGFVFSFTIA